MLKIDKILKIEPYNILCLFNNGVEKKLDVLPLLENHKHLNGVEKLKDPKFFSEAKVGDLGQIYWENIVLNTKTNECWDYDISPEYIFYQKN